MIDIHCHILPGIDDGCQTLDDSLQMAELAVQDGIHTIIATPHHANGRYWNEAAGVRMQVEQLQAELNQRSIPLTIVPGQEIRVYQELVADLHAGKLQALHDSRYLLVEFPTGKIPVRFEETIHELLILGMIPIIAHPERNLELVSSVDKLQQYVEAGALAQVTTHSVLGDFGKKIQNVSLEMCRRNLIHFVASDAHDCQRRKIGLSEAAEMLDKQLGERYGSYCLQNAIILAENKPIERRIAQKLPKKWYCFWK